MGARIVNEITPQADSEGLATTQTLTGAGFVTLNGNLIVNNVWTAIDAAQKIVIDSAGNDLGVIFTITGTDSRGVNIIEAIAGGNGTSVVTENYFKTVSSIAASGATASTITVGLNGLCCSDWVLFNTGSLIDIGLFVFLSSGANLVYNIEHTPDDVNDKQVTSFDTLEHDVLINQTSSQDSNYAFPAYAYRCTVSAYTSGTLKFTSVQAF